MFNVVICTVNRTTQTDGIQREKAALNSHWENSVSFDFSFDFNNTLHEIIECF